MTIGQALKIVQTKFPKLSFTSVVDYENFYVFSSKPKGSDGEIKGLWVSDMIAVDKTNLKILGFNPLVHDASAYSKAAEETIQYL